MTVRGGTAAVAVVMCVLAAGCGRAADQTEQTTGASESPSGTTSSSSAVNPAPAEPAPPTASPAFGYTPELTAEKGAQGTVTYDVHLPQLSGGVDAVRDRFNDGIRSALQDLVYLWYAGGAAHPNQSVSTTVINGDTAQPITYDDLFPNQYAAMERLRQVLPGLDPTGRVRPDNVNVRLEQWLPAPTGVRFYVPVSHAAGDFVPITVPWDRIRDLVDPKIVPVLNLGNAAIHQPNAIETGCGAYPGGGTAYREA
ncbi:hypothetical protein ADUPG1_002693, partial [Aduncisulcus paluster]